jgi:hypothetical protein
MLSVLLLSSIQPHFSLLSNIIHYCFSEGQAADLALDDQFLNAQCRAHQITRLFEFAPTQLHIELSARAIVRTFEVSHTVVARAEVRTVMIHRLVDVIVNSLPTVNRNLSSG